MRKVWMVLAVCLSCAMVSSAQAGRDATIMASDGVLLKATFTPAAKPGPGVILFHQCNRDRKAWNTLVPQLTAAGFHVLAFDYRGFGESGGERYGSLPASERIAVQANKWPGDIDAAFNFLLSQRGVDKNRIGAAGASCGVNQSIQLALIHSQVKSLVLLSGTTDTAGRQFLRTADALPIFAAASDDDGGAVPLLRWVLGFAHNPQNKFAEFKAAGHGTNMFAVEKGLEPMIVEWFEKTLRNAPAKPPARTADAAKPSAMEEFWSLLEEPGGAARAMQYYEDAKKHDPNVFLFPEFAVNALGYERLQAEKAAEAVEIFKINVAAYPASPNVYDSLGDAYVAAGNRELAIQASRKALQVLDATPNLDEQFRKLLRDSAEGKLRTLGAPPAAPQANAVQVTAVEPKAGVTTPGSRVTVYGTGFSPDAVVYFGGLQVRETNFVSPSRLEVVTPYLRPGTYQIQLKSGGIVVRSEVSFTALPSPIDSEIDRAVALAGKGQAAGAIAILTAIAKGNSDYQVRAFAHYQTSQVYFAQGDWWRWGGEAGGVFDDADKSGPAVQMYWRYRLSLDQTDYFLPTNNQPEHDLVVADWTVKYDVTQNPEPRFHRGLVNARYGNLKEARIDSNFILSQDPRNPSYRALAAYIAVLGGDKTQLQSFSGETIKDARALSLLGETAYLSGDVGGAQQWWMLAAKEYPLGAGLAFLAGKKHLARGHKRVAAALLTECTTMAPNSKEAKEAGDLLATLRAPGT